MSSSDDSSRRASTASADGGTPEGDLSPEQWQRIESVFAQTMDANEAERSAILAELKRTDPVVHTEVIEMLRTGDTPRILRTPAEVVGDAPVNDPFLGQRIGPYRIESVIARGGMGVVYRAEQSSPRRIVALKLIRRLHASPRLLRRFQMEVEVLSRLHHPHIAQVYDAGLHDAGEGGTPYFAMEYLPEAQPITDYADQHDLDVEARIRLFLKVCQAVHHGHQRGVIHRDLKPANILVDAEGVPKVIDFGVARSTDTDITITTIETDVGQLVGTIQYMSPEQVEGDPHEIDTRSDVYSLGVVLYELLAGEPPYRVSGTSIFLASQMIRAAEPKPLTRIDRPLPRDLDAVVHRALAKDRDQRYQSAEALCRDLERFLDGQPVEARRPGSWRRTFFWLGRHPIVATCLVWLALIGGIILGINWQISDYRRVLVDPDAYRVAVYDLAGDELAVWYCPYSAQGVIEAKNSNGNGRVLYVKGATDSRHRGWLELYRLNGSFDEPWRLIRLHDKDLPRSVIEDRDRQPEDFTISTMINADVFSELPGHELIVNWAHPMGPSVIQVLDLDGNILYQVLHDGHTNFLGWNEREQLIIACSMHTVRSIGNWVGEDGERLSHHPRTVMFLRPELNMVSTEFIRCGTGSGSIEPIAYFWLQPVIDALDIELFAVPPLGKASDQAVTSIEIRSSFSRQGEEFDPPASFAVLIDIKGRILGSPIYGNVYGHHLKTPEGREKIFPRDHFWFARTPWGEVPPVMSTRDDLQQHLDQRVTIAGTLREVDAGRAIEMESGLIHLTGEIGLNDTPLDGYLAVTGTLRRTDDRFTLEEDMLLDAANPIGRPE